VGVEQEQDQQQDGRENKAEEHQEQYGGKAAQGAESREREGQARTAAPGYSGESAARDDRGDDEGSGEGIAERMAEQPGTTSADQAPEEMREARQRTD
jgi:hypothetical protein